MPGKNPPRKTSIRGQRHMLAYITPDEAALLKARGGTGELHKGIPAYVRGFGGETAAQEARGSGRGGISAGDVERGREDASDRQAARDRAASRAGAVAQTKAQIEQARKAQEAAEKKAKSQGLLRNFLDYINPASKLNAAQNIAAQAMGKRFLNILETDPKATVITSDSRVTGIRDQYGRLTGRDPAQERIDAQDRGDATEERRRRLAAATPPPSDEAIEKRVIRSALAIESEADRARGRRLGRRSLLSRATRLGA